MRILLVEDDEMIGEAVADGLKGEGYAVDWVKDGNSAIIALDTTPFSLVILDLGLPGKDGLAVLKEIRRGNQFIVVEQMEIHEISTQTESGFHIR